MENTTSENLDRILDKFYTNADVSVRFCDIIKSYIDSASVVIEPSAGGGSFLGPIKSAYPNCRLIALDLEPEHQDVSRMNFFDFREIHESGVIIGNPPFGKNSSLAVKFFNHSASLGVSYICFILPKTFMKPRFWEKLSDEYSLIFQEELPSNSFTLSGETYDVPCVMQIWKKQPRVNGLPKTLSLFSNVGKGTIYIRRAGGNAGMIVDSYTKSSTYRVECSQETIQQIRDNAGIIREYASMTAGVRSITLFEIEDILLGRYGIAKRT